MNRQNSITAILRHSLVAFSVLLSTTASVAGASEPSQCIRPTITPPAMIAMTPATPSLPMATTINVLQHGAVGNGTTNDTAVIQSLIDANPYGTIYFPMGLYLLNNHGLTQHGLSFIGFHGTAIMQAGARFLCDTIASSLAGLCIDIADSSNATFDNFRIGYIGGSALPWARNSAGNGAMLVIASQNITFQNTRVETSPGSGIWVTDSTGIHFTGTMVTYTSADGLHFENDGSSTVNGYYALVTGDDALSSTNESYGTVNCGLTATNIQIHESLSTGIAVRGGCGAKISNFYIDTTANSGIGTGQDPNFGTRVPTNNTFSDGIILNSGRYSSPVVSGKDCIDISLATNTTVNSVNCVYPLQAGVFVDNGASAITLDGVSVDAAPQGSFVVADATNVWFKNTVSRGTPGSGYALMTGYVGGSMSGDTSCDSGGYNFYHAGSSNISESNLTSYDSSMNSSLHRAWWAENGVKNISLDGLSLYDDHSASPIIVGEVAPSGYVSIDDVRIISALGSFLISLND